MYRRCFLIVLIIIRIVIVIIKKDTGRNVLSVRVEVKRISESVHYIDSVYLQYRMEQGADEITTG